MNATELAAVAALLASMRQFRAQSPTSTYRTEYRLVISNIVACSCLVKTEVLIE